MADDLLETLWREFAAETEEHFELVEPLLVQAETAGATAADIAQLFRSMHSVKGLARAMAMQGMETVAHHAEHLLGLVRDGRCALDRPMVAVLLAVIDALKIQREAVTRDRQDVPAPEPLMRELERMRLAIEDDHADAAAPGTAASGTAEAEAIPLHEDQDMLRYFVEGLQSVLPALAKLVGPELADPEVRLEIERALEIVRQGADILGFPEMVRTVDRITALMPESGALTETARDSAISLLAAIKQEVATLEAATQAEGGGLALGQALNGVLRREFEVHRHALLEVLGQFENQNGGDQGDGEVAAQAAALARSIFMYFAFLDCTHAGRLMLMLEDVFSRVTSGEVFLSPEILGLARDVLGAIARPADTSANRGGTGGDELIRDLDAGDADRLLERFRQSLLSSSGATCGSDPMSVVRQYLAELKIAPELLEILTADQMRALMAALREGRENLFEITAFLESNEAVAYGFVSWLQAHGKAITNRTVFAEGNPCFEFLVVTALDTAAVHAALRALDPDGKYLSVKECRAKAPSPNQPAPAQPAQTAAARAGAGPEHRREPRAGGGAEAGGSVLRVRGETIDRFLAAIGEMVMVNSMLDTAVHGDDGRATFQLELKRLLKDLRTQGTVDPALLESLARCIAAQDARNRKLRNVRERLSSSLGRLQESALELRVVPVDTVFNRFPRIVRDMSQAQGKQIRLDLEGNDVRIDKGMVELLVEPLIHMVRNAVDHGIESAEERRAAGKPPVGCIILRADQRENRVVVEIADDGRGLNAEKIRAKAVARGMIGEAESRKITVDDLHRFVLAPGFSTAEAVTETSGRGVGMDVVHSNVARLGGAIDIRSQPGSGTTFTLKLPLSAAIQDVLLVDVQDQVLAIPDRYLSEICEAGADALQIVHGQPAILLRGRFLPLFHLGDLLGNRDAAPPADGAGDLPILVLTDGRRRIGVRVDRVLRRQELFVKDIHASLAAIPGVGGAALLGDGRVVLILDGGDLFHLAESLSGDAPRAAAS